MSHCGPESLEEAVQNYVNRNVDLYDLPYMSAVRSGGVNDAISLILLVLKSFICII